MRSTPPKLLIDIFSKKEKFFLFILLSLWVVLQINFWNWWFTPEHIISPWKTAINSAVLAWAFILPSYFFFFLWRGKKISPSISVPKNWRVAMVVTKTPIEPWPMVKKTLKAMLGQEFKHDTWLADEDPDNRVILWCRKNKVKLISRKNQPDYQNESWPRRRNTKEGNLAYFYDKVGYRKYDFVVQMDADHIPEKGYLEEMLKPFINPKVGYVTAPSICDLNQNSSWAARGRLYAEATLHGPLQTGYNAWLSPICIGSHYAVRTAALKKIGGLGPELAEDHSTTLMMQGAGFTGVHSLWAIAHGNGPINFTDCMHQEYQWSRSLTVIFFTLLPKHFLKLPVRQKILFVFSEIWYPVFSFCMLTAYLLPVLAIINRSPWVEVNFIDFSVYTFAFSLLSLIIIYWAKRKNLLRPESAKLISWEAPVFQLVRWPWILMGVLSGLLGVISRKNLDFRITPKERNYFYPIAYKYLAPYIIIVLLYSLVAIFINNPGNAQGYYFFLLINGFSYFLVLLIVLLRHMEEATN